MTTSAKTRNRSWLQWTVTGVFGLLAMAFVFRVVQYGSKWLRQVTEADLNFKALTLWALVYVVVCGGIAAVAYFMPRDAEDEVLQNADRGT